MREIRIRDTLSGELRTLTPQEPPRVGVYACGPTVYSRIHIGNARPFVVFTLLSRFLAHQGYQPTLVINVTDINDKIYDAARDAGVGSAEYAAEMTRLYIADTDALGLGRPDAEPLASETLDGIVELIETLIERGSAYESGGDVYFAVRSFDAYGALSNRDPDEMDQGEEAGSAELKRDRLDFALWKASKPGEDTSWPAPWGRGRPGWHIECSAMAEAILGTELEIHGGGADLVFPHHENEIAQTEAARGVPLARLWMHNGMVELASEKMSKSVGNVFGLAEAVSRFGPEAVIGFLVAGHYRQPLSFDQRSLEQSEARNERIRDFFRTVERIDADDADPAVDDAREAFLSALAHDFNTPQAMAVVYELIAEGHRRSLPGAHAALEELLWIVGLDSLAQVAEEADPEALELLAERERARDEREFARADELRDELERRGWTVRDTPAGARLVRRR